MDLVSYNSKNNHVIWPFGPSDRGTDTNHSWDSRGDHNLFARTQNGNNSPYKIDSIGIWQNFGMIGTPSPTAIPTGGSGAYHDNYGTDSSPTGKNGLFLFIKFLLQLRKLHPCLRQARFGDLVMDEKISKTSGAWRALNVVFRVV
jgi:glycogen operon protein